MALHRLVQVLVSHLAVTDLHGFIAVVFDCLLLGHDAGTCLDDSNRNELAVLIKELSHTDLLADNVLLHFLSYLLRLLVDFTPT